VRLRAALAATFAVAGSAAPPRAAAQGRQVVEAERAEFAAWIRDHPLSPRRAVVVRPIGPGLTLGPSAADIPLEGVARSLLQEKEGRVTLTGAGPARAVPRGRPISLGRWQLLVTGPPGRAAAAVFGPAAAGKAPAWFPYDPRAAYTVALAPPAAPGTVRVLGPDGVEVDADEAGTVAVPLPGGPAALRVLRLPGATEEETELEIYFRDATSGRGTYPAGRFVALIPRPDGRYLLDFNRARNPWCAYNTVFPCPAPWRGNALAGSVDAGERYLGGGLDVPKPE
jgi:hypothetical protein